MRQKIDPRVPRYSKLILPTFIALKELGGSGSNDEIYNRIVADLQLPNDVVDISHLGNANMSELQYQLAWSRTYLRKAGIIQNSARSIWSICPDYMNADTVDERTIVASVVRESVAIRRKQENDSVDIEPEDGVADNDDLEFPDEIKPWRTRLSEILQRMDPYGFERLSQRVLRECGFSQVEVTRKSGDGGIDGTGKLKINGIFSFNVAFQCKRYCGLVGAGAIRDFRGSLTTDIEKGVLITTGAFSKAARDEATNPGKQQIDLIDGEEFISKIAEYGIGVREIKSYEIDEDFFAKI